MIEQATIHYMLAHSRKIVPDIDGSLTDSRYIALADFKRSEVPRGMRWLVDPQITVHTTLDCLATLLATQYGRVMQQSCFYPVYHFSPSHHDFTTTVTEEGEMDSIQPFTPERMEKFLAAYFPLMHEQRRLSSLAMERNRAKSGILPTELSYRVEKTWKILNFLKVDK